MDHLEYRDELGYVCADVDYACPNLRSMCAQNEDLFAGGDEDVPTTRHGNFVAIEKALHGHGCDGKQFQDRNS
jgi:hypothetical protein